MTNLTIYIIPYITFDASERHKVHLSHYKHNNNTFMKNLKMTMLHKS